MSMSDSQKGEVHNTTADASTAPTATGDRKTTRANAPLVTTAATRVATSSRFPRMPESSKINPTTAVRSLSRATIRICRTATKTKRVEDLTGPRPDDRSRPNRLDQYR